MERLFTIIAPKQPRNKRSFKYQPLNGKKALNLMKVLHGRDFQTIAETDGCGGIEQLTLDEMQAIYAEVN